jgi:ABC-type transport system involved in cytochrome c biogenesis permease subunit
MSKRKRSRSAAAAAPPPPTTITVAQVFPWAVVALGALILFIGSQRWGSPDDQPNYASVGQLPVIDHGRIKPFDTLARTSMMLISHRETFADNTGKSGQPAVRWLLDVLTYQEPSDSVKGRITFTIDNDELLKLLKLPKQEDHLYSVPEILPQRDALEDRAIEIIQRRVPRDQLSRYEKDVLDLYRFLNMTETLTSNRAVNYPVFRIENDQLLEELRLEMRPGSYRYSLAEIAPNLLKLERLAHKAREKDEHQRDLVENKTLELWRKLELYSSLIIQDDQPRLYPPDRSKDEWMTEREVVRAAKMGQRSTSAAYWAAIRQDWKDDKFEEFNKSVVAYRKWLDDKYPAEMERASFEVSINHFAPFFWCQILYVAVGVLSFIGMLVWERPLNRAAFWLMVLTLLVHTWAMFIRMYLMERPLVFVTNLYSSAVFIGWGCVVLGVILEALYKNGVGNLIGSVSGYVTLVIAAGLAMDGDTLEMMRAVLDTNFWLATHVTAVTLGYTATFLASGLGALFIFRAFLTRMSSDSLKMHTQMIYGIVCFGMFFSFLGTVLGGIWADQSWGRFWGWDPKENGALLIVIWNALILHARWGGMVKQRGIAVLAVLGGIITAWSWFGTNMLGVGLHSYGFMAGAFQWLLLYAMIKLAIAGMGMLPLSMWQSFKKPEPTARELNDLPVPNVAISEAITSSPR